MKIRILKKDFDAAVRQPWSYSTCILAQCALRCGILHSTGEPKVLCLTDDDGPRMAQQTFDIHFRIPGDEKQSHLQALRASLPIAFTPNY